MHSVARADPPLVVPVVGEPFRADLAACDANWQLTFRTDRQNRGMPAADLVCWGQWPEQGRAGGLVLAGGSWLAGEVTAADRQKLTANSNPFGVLPLPLESLLGVVFRQPSNQADRDKLFDRLAGQVANLPGDCLLLDNGDELAGRFLGIADGTLKFETDVGPIDVKIERVTALVFKTPQHKPSASSDPLRVWTGFRGGSRLLATQLVVNTDGVQLSVAGQSLKTQQAELAFLQPLGGRAVYLSDLKPAEYRHTPFLDLPWPYHGDRNVTGGFLRCGGRPYLKGLGVHSAARLVYQLGEGPPAGVKQFQAELGVDDSTAGGGSVQFRVLVDGQEKFTSPIIRGGNPPTPVSVDLTGGKKLELVVDYADRADVLDHADWLNARLTK